jgi:hypothetical protein
MTEKVVSTSMQSLWKKLHKSNPVTSQNKTLEFVEDSPLDIQALPVDPAQEMRWPVILKKSGDFIECVSIIV